MGVWDQYRGTRHLVLGRASAAPPLNIRNDVHRTYILRWEMSKLCYCCVRPLKGLYIELVLPCCKLRSYIFIYLFRYIL